MIYMALFMHTLCNVYAYTHIMHCMPYHCHITQYTEHVLMYTSKEACHIEEYSKDALESTLGRSEV